MACPLPSQFENLVPLDPDNPTCEELAAIMTELPKLLLEWWSCWFREDGTLTDEFSDSICAISCGDLPPIVNLPCTPDPESCGIFQVIAKCLIDNGGIIGPGDAFISTVFDAGNTYYAEFTPVTGPATNSFHIGIAGSTQAPNVTAPWAAPGAGVVFRFDGAVFLNGNSTAFAIVPGGMTLGVVHSITWNGPTSTFTVRKADAVIYTQAFPSITALTPLLRIWAFAAGHTTSEALVNLGPTFIYTPPVGAISTCAEVTTTTTTTTTPEPVQSPSAYWRMEETGANDNRVDATGNGNFLTAAGVSFSASGKANGCCELEGTLGINPTALLAGSYSFVGWVYTQDQASRTFLSVQNGATLLEAHFSHSAGDVIYSLSGDATTSSFPAQASSAWAFVAVIVDAGVATMLKNGIADAPITAPPVAGTPDRFYLAINEGGLDFTRIDEWQLYNYAITATEVNHVYNSGAGRFYPY
jgi:hypothetical protein